MPQLEQSLDAALSDYRPFHPTTEPLAGDFIPDSYLMHIRTNECTSCGTIERWSETLLVSVHRTNMVRRLSPIHSTDWNPNLPIGFSKLQTRRVPICAHCIRSHTPMAAVSSLNQPQPTATLDYTSAAAQRAWAETLARKYAKPPTERSDKQHKPTIVAGVDQL